MAACDCGLPLAKPTTVNDVIVKLTIILAPKHSSARTERTTNDGYLTEDASDGECGNLRFVPLGGRNLHPMLPAPAERGPSLLSIHPMSNFSLIANFRLFLASGFAAYR
jgi:hypothetical protein